MATKKATSTVPPDIELSMEIAPIPVKAKELAVRSMADADWAIDYLKQVVIPLKKKIVDHFSTMKSTARAAWQATIDKEKEDLGPVEEAEKTIRQKVKVYLDDQDRIARAKKAEEDRIAREEQERLLQQQEKDRKDALELEEAFGASDEQLQRLAHATPPELLPAPQPISETRAAAPSGSSRPRKWKASVDDKMKFIKHVAEHPDLAYLLTVNQPFLDSMAVTNKTEGELYPGIRAYQETGLRI